MQKCCLLKSGSWRAFDNPLLIRRTPFNPETGQKETGNSQIKTEANIKGYMSDREQIECKRDPSCLWSERAGPRSAERQPYGDGTACERERELERGFLATERCTQAPHVK